MNIYCFSDTDQDSDGESDTPEVDPGTGDYWGGGNG